MLLRRRLGGILACVLVVVAMGLAATWPTTTTQGLNFELSTRRIPLAIKLMGLLQRDYEYRRLAREVTQGLNSDVEEAMALFEWTRTHIRPTPEGFPVVDDHILGIIIRGYGEGDQMADVFTTLTTYAGVPAFWQSLKSPESGQHNVVLSFAKVEGDWTVWDAMRGVVFRDDAGRLMSFNELAHDAMSAVTATTPKSSAGPWYQPSLGRMLRSVEFPGVLRAELQMPGRRLWFELTRWLRG